MTADLRVVVSNDAPRQSRAERVHEILNALDLSVRAQALIVAFLGLVDGLPEDAEPIVPRDLLLDYFEASQPGSAARDRADHAIGELVRREVLVSYFDRAHVYQLHPSRLDLLPRRRRGRV